MSYFCTDPKQNPQRYSKFPKNFFVTPGRKYYPNPGTINNIHKKVFDIIPHYLDGVELWMKKGLAPNKTLITNWTLSHTTPSEFHIGGIYNWRCRGNILETPTIECNINPSTLTSNFKLTYYPISSFKIESQFSHIGNENFKTLGIQNVTSLEYTKPYSTTNFCLYDPKKEAGQLTVSYLRSVTKKLALGSEFFFEWLNKGITTKIALAAKYNENKRAIAGTITIDALDLSYWHQIHKSIQMGTLFAFNRCSKKAYGALCYQYDFNSGTTIRGMIDSDCSVGFMYERSSMTMPCLMGFNLLFCIPTGRFTIGLKLNFDPTIRCNTK
ncbi:mitochondrial import receptor subunit TOM40 homolog [Condylostylus longicornis]|uniref:mitochondrial import receptor subunit TOM40 homolog n=1 Tax=Condylostylus longicornis TaxID=2530218 RepID=UPI00244E067D|nr:mitochondrial import receptor subunit TOM40 homolog [Condylostylus longicornis]